MPRVRSILAARPDDLEKLVAHRGAAVEEVDFADGNFNVVWPTTDVVETNLEDYPITLGTITVGRYLTDRKNCPDPEAIAHALGHLYQRNWTDFLLKETITPIPLDVSEEIYIKNLSERILFGTRARYIIVRLSRGIGHLRELQAIHIIDLRSQLSLLLSDYDIGPHHPSRAIYEEAERLGRKEQRYTRVLRRTTDPEIFASMQNRGSEDISSIMIVPLSLGGNVIGFVNVGYDIDFDVDGYLDLTFGSIFNHAFAAFEHYRRLNELTHLRGAQARDFVSRTSTEILQGFRHVAQNILLVAYNAGQDVEKYYKYTGPPNKSPLALLHESHREMQTALLNMAAVRLGDEGKSRQDVFDLFVKAADILKPQTDAADIKIRMHRAADPRGYEANVDGTAIQTAFYNLILNSIQAFEQANTKNSDRKITVSFSRSGSIIKIEYADEGPGVRLGGDIRQVGDIWVIGKSSKRKGAGHGHGLPASREIFQTQHKGSLNLMRSTRGVLFEIQLDDDLTSPS